MRPPCCLQTDVPGGGTWGGWTGKTVGPVTAHACAGQVAGTVSPGPEQTDRIHPLKHWQLHFACSSVEQISPKPRTAIFRDRVIRRSHRHGGETKRPQPTAKPGPPFQASGSKLTPNGNSSSGFLFQCAPTQSGPDIGAAMTAGFAGKLWFEIRQPDLARPDAGAVASWARRHALRRRGLEVECNR